MLSQVLGERGSGIDLWYENRRGRALLHLRTGGVVESFEV